jgi:hypothetical protein
MVNVPGDYQRRGKMKHFDLGKFLEGCSWFEDIDFLVQFLNLPIYELFSNQIYERYKALGGLDEIREVFPSWKVLGQFRDEIKSVLDDFDNVYCYGDAYALEERLEDKLKSFGLLHTILIQDLEQGNIRVSVGGDTGLESLWTDFIFVFLTQNNCREILGRCYHCEKWYARGRRDQLYCDDICRGKAAYRKNRGAGDHPRRVGYRRGNLL